MRRKFLRAMHPYLPFNKTVALTHLWSGYQKKAGIERYAHDGKGFHALRRTLGKELTLAEVPVTTTAQILGHRSMDSSKQYISLDSYHLKECARYFWNAKPKETYIFSDSELSSLFSAIDTLAEDKKIPYTRQMLPVLFRLIYTCGLRPQEGRELKRRNINFQTGEILITNTKKKKERFVVMSDDMLMLCRRYDKMRQFFYEDNPYFFPGSSEGPLDGQWLNRQFQKCWQTVNPGVPKEQLPSVRVYSLRHQFATANVNRWLDEQKDLDAMLPRLRAYMGHYTLKETAYYVHLLPENLSKNRGLTGKPFPRSFRRWNHGKNEWKSVIHTDS